MNRSFVSVFLSLSHGKPNCSSLHTRHRMAYKAGGGNSSQKRLRHRFMNSEKHQATYQSLLPARRGQDKARTMSSDPATPITMLVTCINTNHTHHNTCYTHHTHQHHFQHSMHASRPFKNICHMHIITGHSTHHTSKLVITHSCHQSLTLVADTSTPPIAHTNTINTSRNTHQHQSHNSSHQSHLPSVTQLITLH